MNATQVRPPAAAEPVVPKGGTHQQSEPPPVTKVTGARLLIRALKAHGIHRIFSLPGAPLFPVYEACLDEGVEVIAGRHEANLVHCAEGVARSSGKPAVVILAPGPGMSNGVPGVSVAWAERSPVIVFTGIDVLANLGRGGRQELPNVEMHAPITKWSVLLSDGKRMFEYVARAIRNATTGLPGPVHIAVTADSLSGLFDPSEMTTHLPAASMPTAAPGAEPAFIEQTLSLFAEAERPLIIAGGAAFFANAGQALRAFIETAKIPLFTVEQARGLVSDDHPYCFGEAYGTVNPCAQLFGRSDLIMVLGERLDAPFSYGSVLGPAKLIHVCPDPDEIGKNRPVVAGAACDARVVTEQLLEAAKERKWPQREEWLQTLRQTKLDHRTRARQLALSDETPVHPARIVHEVEKLLDEQSTLVFDGGDFHGWARYCATARKPGGWLASTVLGHLGIGLPYAMGAKLAFPESRVAVLSGDGAIGFSVMEFETAVRHNIPVVVVVANDGGYGIEVYYQERWFGPDRIIATELGKARYDLMAQAMGGHGEFVQTPDQLAPALQRAFASGKPACVNVLSLRTPSPMTQTYSRAYLMRRAKARKAT